MRLRENGQEAGLGTQFSFIEIILERSGQKEGAVTEKGRMV